MNTTSKSYVVDLCLHLWWLLWSIRWSFGDDDDDGYDVD